MNDESQDNRAGSSRGLVWVWLCWLAVIVALYVLSSGPFLMMLDKGIIRLTSLEEVIIFVYAPFDWAYDNTLLHKPLGMYVHFWAPGQFDKKGNPIPQ